MKEKEKKHGEKKEEGKGGKEGERETGEGKMIENSGGHNLLQFFLLEKGHLAME